MAQNTITFRTDPAVKVDFEQFCSSVGMNTSTALNLFMRATVAQQAIPFPIRRYRDAEE